MIKALWQTAKAHPWLAAIIAAIIIAFWPLILFLAFWFAFWMIAFNLGEHVVHNLEQERKAKMTNSSGDAIIDIT